MDQEEQPHHINNGTNGSPAFKITFKGILDKILKNKSKNGSNLMENIESERNNESIASITESKSIQENDTIRLLEVQEIKHKNLNQNNENNKGFLKQNKRAINYYLNQSVHNSAIFKIPEIASISSRNDKSLLRRRSQVLEKQSLDNFVHTPNQNSSSLNVFNTQTSSDGKDIVNSYKKIKFICKRRPQKQQKLTSRVYAVDEINDFIQ